MEEDGYAVAKWSIEQLEEWARDNITKDTLPQLAWHQRQVAIWARKALHFDEEDEAALKKAKLNGLSLAAVPSFEALIKLYGIAPGPAGVLWTKIVMQKSLAEPAVTDRKRKRSDSSSNRSPSSSKKHQSELGYLINSVTPNTIPVPQLAAYVNRNLPWMARTSNGIDIVENVLKIVRETMATKILNVRSTPLFTVTGASGLGKTRLGVELLQLLQSKCAAQGDADLTALFTKSRLVFLNFSTGDLVGVKKKVTKEDLYGQLAFRILYPQSSFEDDQFESTAISRLTFISLINKLRASSDEKFCLHVQIDEFQKGLSEEDFASIAAARKDVPLRSYLTTLLKIAAGLRIFNIYTIISCTGIFPATDFLIVKLPLHLLPQRDALALVEQQVGGEKIKIPFIKTLVKAMGGLPKALNALVAKIQEIRGDLSGSISTIWKGVCTELSQSYRFPHNLQLLGQITTASILAKEFEGDAYIGGQTIFQLEEDVQGKYKLSVPYVLMSRLRGSYNSFAFGNIFSTETFPPILTSSDFEQFVLYFQAWKYHEESKLGKDIALSSLHQGACRADIANITVGPTEIMPECRTSKSENVTDHDLQSSQFVLTNGVVNLTKRPIALWIGRSCVGMDSLILYTSSTSTPNSIAVLTEVKHTIPAQEAITTIQKGEIEKEVNDFKMRKHQFEKFNITAYSAFITNKTVDKRAEQRNLFDIFVDKENFKVYFGPVFGFLEDVDF